MKNKQTLRYMYRYPERERSSGGAEDGAARKTTTLCYTYTLRGEREAGRQTERGRGGGDKGLGLGGNFIYILMPLYVC